MAEEFKAITTQEELEAVLKDRLKRAEEKFTKKYEGYTSPEDMEKIVKEHEEQINGLNSIVEKANEKAKKYDTDIAERDSKIKAYEISGTKAKIAREAGLQYEAIDFLKGETEDEIKKSAEGLKSLLGGNKEPAPLARDDVQPSGNSEDFNNQQAMKKLLHGLTGKSE